MRLSFFISWSWMVEFSSRSFGYKLKGKLYSVTQIKSDIFCFDVQKFAYAISELLDTVCLPATVEEDLLFTSAADILQIRIGHEILLDSKVTNLDNKLLMKS